MNWFYIMLIPAAAIIGFGLFTAAQSPRFVAGIGSILSKAAWDVFIRQALPAVVKVAAKRMSPEDEAKWRKARRANQPAPYRGKGNPHPGEKD